MAAGHAGGVVDFVRGFEAQAFARAVIEGLGDGRALELGERGEVGAFRKVLADEAVGVFVSATFPGVVRSCEVDGNAKLSFDGFVGVEFSAVIGGDGFEPVFVWGEEFDGPFGGVFSGGARQFSDSNLAAEAIDDGDDAGFA